MNLNLVTRKLHRWGAIVFAAPMLLVIVSGLFLQVKKQVPWVQPPSQRGVAPNDQPAQLWGAVLEVSRGIPEASVAGWEDIRRLYVEIGKGTIKILCKNGWEIQIDSQTGEVLSSTRRRSDLIESLHDGTFFSDIVKMWVFLPNGIVLLVLWCTGLWLWYLPIRNRRKRRSKPSPSET